jgi:hypothetical protein
MVARGTKRSNQRPDTLMQDRHPPNRKHFLRHTAGPYIRVIHVISTVRQTKDVMRQAGEPDVFLPALFCSPTMELGVDISLC